MTTIVYYDNEIMADTKALMYHQNGLDTKSTFRKGIKILKNDHLIVTSFGFMFPEDKQEEILETAEWLAKALSKVETYKNGLGAELIELNFTGLMIEKLVQFVDPDFKLGDKIESSVCIITRDRTVVIGSDSISFIPKVSNKKATAENSAIGYNHVIEHGYRAKDQSTYLLKNKISISTVDNDKIDYYVSGTGERYVMGAVKLGLAPKEGFKLAIRMDLVSSVALSNNEYTCYNVKDLKVLKPFTVKEVKQLIKGE